MNYLLEPPIEYYEHLIEEKVHRYDLGIGDIQIFAPYKTEIPWLAFNGFIHKNVIKNQRLKPDTDEVTIKQALRMAIKLIGLNYKKKLEKTRYEKIIINQFLVNITRLKTDTYHKGLFDFILSDYLSVITNEQTVPLIRLLNIRPDIVCYDSVVHLSIGLLREQIFLDTKSIAKRARKILELAGLKIFIPKEPQIVRSDNRALLAFSKKPNLLILLVLLYEQVINDYIKSSYSRDDSAKKKKMDIDQAFQTIYQTDINPSINFNKEKQKDKKSIALTFISQEFSTPFEGLKKIYYKNSKGFNFIIHSRNYDFNKIKRYKPALDKWLNRLEDQLKH